MRGKIITFCLVIAFSNAVCAGEIFRCVAANGDVSFTNVSCPAKSQVQHVSSYEPVPDVPPPTYNPPTFPVHQPHESAQQVAQAGYEQAQGDRLVTNGLIFTTSTQTGFRSIRVYGSNFHHHCGRHDRPCAYGGHSSRAADLTCNGSATLTKPTVGAISVAWRRVKTIRCKSVDVSLHPAIAPDS